MKDSSRSCVTGNVSNPRHVLTPGRRHLPRRKADRRIHILTRTSATEHQLQTTCPQTPSLVHPLRLRHSIGMSSCILLRRFSPRDHFRCGRATPVIHLIIYLLLFRFLVLCLSQLQLKWRHRTGRQLGYRQRTAEPRLRAIRATLMFRSHIRINCIEHSPVPYQLLRYVTASLSGFRSIRS